MGVGERVLFRTDSLSEPTSISGSDSSVVSDSNSSRFLTTRVDVRLCFGVAPGDILGEAAAFLRALVFLFVGFALIGPFSRIEIQDWRFSSNSESTGSKLFLIFSNLGYNNLQFAPFDFFGCIHMMDKV
jgi:tetrahydromethanopterin S-methyltransferase subunit F